MRTVPLDVPLSGLKSEIFFSKPLLVLVLFFVTVGSTTRFLGGFGQSPERAVSETDASIALLLLAPAVTMPLAVMCFGVGRPLAFCLAFSARHGKAPFVC